MVLSMGEMLIESINFTNLSNVNSYHVIKLSSLVK